MAGSPGMTYGVRSLQYFCLLYTSNNNIDPVSLERLRGECVKEVKRLNGSFSFDDAVNWQKGWEEND